MTNEVPKKLDKNPAEKMIKQAKGLVVCEEQAAYPWGLPKCGGCCSNPGKQSAPLQTVAFAQTISSQHDYNYPHKIKTIL